jgi:tetraacyldisaccharide 4'-kinase
MPWYRHLLWPVALVYGFFVGLRNLLFDYRILPSKQFDVPVICVGNLEMGGTGKSRVVIYIVQMLLAKGKNVAVISRGYGRKTTGLRMVDTDSNATEVGDEPLQLKRRHPECMVAVSENRVKGIEHLLQMVPKPDYVVMDDGFQHRWVNPSLSMLVTNAQFPFMHNSLFPVGTLREPTVAAARADIKLFMDVIETSDSTWSASKDTFQTATVVKKEVQIAGFGKELKLAETIISFSGIANPARFEELVNRNFNVLEHVSFSDHHNYSTSDIKRLRKKIDSFGTAVKAIVTTEKDAVRLMSASLLNEFGEIPVYYLPIDMEILFGKAADFDKMILGNGKHA